MADTSGLLDLPGLPDLPDLINMFDLEYYINNQETNMDSTFSNTIDIILDSIINNIPLEVPLKIPLEVPPEVPIEILIDTKVPVIDNADSMTDTLLCVPTVITKKEYEKLQIQYDHIHLFMRRIKTSTFDIVLLERFNVLIYPRHFIDAFYEMTTKELNRVLTKSNFTAQEIKTIKCEKRRFKSYDYSKTFRAKNRILIYD